MRVNIQKKLEFDVEFIEQAIESGRSMQDICAELKTAPMYVEKRIRALFDDIDAESKIEALYKKADRSSAANTAAKKSVSGKPQANIPSPSGKANIEVVQVTAQKGPELFVADCVTGTKRSAQEEEEPTPDFLDYLAKHVCDGVEYALGQLAADEAVGERYEAVDTSASRAELKRLDTEIGSLSKKVSEAQSKVTEKQVAKTTAEERVERATEKLRRAKIDAAQAISDLEGAERELKRYSGDLEAMRRKRDAMERDINNRELPTFSIVPSGDYIVLKAVNYDARSFDLDSALKWSRRIAEKFHDLTDSEFSVMGRLFGILSKMKGKGRFKVTIDPRLTKVLEVWAQFENCFN